MILMAINWFELWQKSWPAGLTVLLLSLLFAVGLLIASERLKVQQDERVERVFENLPNANCGACGFAGCQEYAKAVAADPALLGKCFPGGQKTLEKIAQILNIQMSNAGALKRPVVHCRAHSADKTYYAKYQGIASCTSANAVANAQACKFGCMGFGDCVRSCKFDALHIADGLSTVDYEKCTGCGACARTCPRNLIIMTPFAKENIITVACNSRENGKTTRVMCKVGCIACGLCAKNASPMFVLQDNLAKVDYDKYADDEKSNLALSKCPTKVIIRIGKNILAKAEVEEQAATA
jgi:Na+-translocating ferredoxin:NAD+ oxidoreductase subunit B